MKPMQLLLAAAIALSAPAALVLAQRQPDPVPAGLACPLKAKPMVRLELLFGLSRPHGPVITDAEWQAFLDAEVTPRFPDGFTVLSGYGQYRDSAGRIVQEGARMLVVWHAPADRNGDIEAIREAYKARFTQESVLRADGSNCVSL
ncbi:MAG: DUF3574 domain-containing protein [Hyphomicrobiaceae bacterium]|jgi:hypothetical protein|nr:MAG: DUF3574 domain-containing protein [Hyphomicrobiaceae bacterium]